MWLQILEIPLSYQTRSDLTHKTLSSRRRVFLSRGKSVTSQNQLFKIILTSYCDWPTVYLFSTKWDTMKLNIRVLHYECLPGESVILRLQFYSLADTSWGHQLFWLYLMSSPLGGVHEQSVPLWLSGCADWWGQVSLDTTNGRVRPLITNFMSPSCTCECGKCNLSFSYLLIKLHSFLVTKAFFRHELRRNRHNGFQTVRHVHNNRKISRQFIRRC